VNDRFILVRKRREYTQSGTNPKISVDKQTYEALQSVAAESGRSLSEIARQAIGFALERLSWVDEE